MSYPAQYSFTRPVYTSQPRITVNQVEHMCFAKKDNPRSLLSMSVAHLPCLMAGLPCIIDCSLFIVSKGKDIGCQ